MTIVPVYEFVYADDSVFGVGTERELRQLQAEGIVDADARTGKLVCYEPQHELA